MLHNIAQVLVFLVTIFVIVLVHEWGHFWVARRCGVKVLKFSIGFGRALWRRFGRDGTEYVIAWLPLGGYVKLLDEREGPVFDEERHRAFNRQSLWVRSAIVIAGPLVNLLFAFLVFWLMWMVGVQQVKPIISGIEPDSIAAASHVPGGGEVVSVDGRPVDSWSSAIMLLVRRLGDKDDLKLGLRTQQSTQPQQFTLPLANWQINSLQPDLLKSLGITPYSPPTAPVIKKVMENSPAAKAGLEPGDRILSIDTVHSEDWKDFAPYIQHHPKKLIDITVERGQQTLDLPVQTDWKLTKLRPIGYIGIEVKPGEWPADMKEKRRYNPGQAFIRAAKDVWSFTQFNFIVLGKIVTGDISLLTLSGPIAIFQTTNLAFAQGLVVYAGFLGLISIMLACLNILPIPGLDGSHLLFFLIEKIIRRPVSVALQVLIFRLGFIALMLLMMQATVNDLLRFFQ